MLIAQNHVKQYIDITQKEFEILQTLLKLQEVCDSGRQIDIKIRSEKDTEIVIEKIYRAKLVTGGMKTIRQKVTDVYAQFKAQMPWLSFVFLTVKQYQDRNIIYDASPRIDLLQRDNFNSIGMYFKQCYNTFDGILHDARFTNYKKKYFIINIDDSIKIDVKYLMKINVRTPVQVFFYRLFNDIETMRDWIGETFIVMNTSGMFTYFTLTPEMIDKGINRILFRFMKGMWAYAAHDAAGMLEVEEDITTAEAETPEREEPATEQKLTKIAKKLISNRAASNEPLKTALAEIIPEKEKHQKISAELLEKEKDNQIDNAISALKAMSIDINKTGSKPILIKVSKADNVDDTIDKLDEAVSEADPEESGEEADGEGTITPKTDEREKEINDIYEQAIEVAKDRRLPNRTPEVTKRIKLLKSSSEKIRMDGRKGKTLKELLVEFEQTSLDNEELPAQGVTNKSVKYATGQALAKTYYKKQFDADIATMMKQFANAPDLNMVVTGIQKEDVSDTMNGLLKYTFNFEDEYGKQHTVSYNIPKLIDNKFFLIGGNKKMLTGQIASIPVIKVKPDEVRIATAHNQMEVHRVGQAFDPKVEILKKLMTKFPGNGYYGVTYRSGDSTEINMKYDTTLEYDKLSSMFYSIVIESSDKHKSVSFVFNQHDIRAMFEDLDIAYIEKPGLIPIAIRDDKKILYIDINTGVDTEDKKFTICDLIFSAIRQYSTIENPDKIITGITVPKKYMYSRIQYLSRWLSMGLFLGYLFGITELLKAMGSKYQFIKESLPKDSRLTQNHIKFKDGYLYYTIYPTRDSLILNGIANDMDTESFTFAELDTESPYLLTFDKLFQTRQMAKGFQDCKTWMIDFKSAQVMRALQLPDTFLPIMLYANSLLEDNSIIDPKATTVNRIRNLELIPCVFMYKSLVQTYIQYKYRYSKTGKMHVAENDIIEKMNASGLFRDYDTLNPIREIETEGSITFKGPGGCKVTDAYSLSRRAYDKTMVGVFAASSPDSADVGISKYLTLNPRITSTLGFMKSGETDNPEEIDYGNIGSVAELLVPMAIDHDDAKRLGMVGKESKHLMAASETDPLLICNGVEKVVPYMTSNDFVTIAKKNGKVLKVDTEHGLAIVEYTDGERESIDIMNRSHKDGGMGFYVVSRKVCDFKEGDEFKKNDVLARNPSYFSTENGASKPEFNPGVLANVALITSSTTFEDSAMITERIAHKMSTDVVMLKQIVLGGKANLHKMVKVGDNVLAGEALAIYEDEIDDPEINRMISNAPAKDLIALEELTKRTPHSKVTGIVHDIKIYYTIPTTEMSDSVREVVDTYNNRIKARKKIINSYKAKNPSEIITDYVGITKPTSGDKIHGTNCPPGKLLIEVYVKYTDSPNSGDKIVFFSALKATLTRTLPQHLAPYPVNHPEEPIDAILSPIGLEKRMVSSVLYMLLGNKCVWGLKQTVKQIFDKYAKKEANIKDVTTHEDFELVKGLTDLGYSAKEIVSVLS